RRFRTGWLRALLDRRADGRSSPVRGTEWRNPGNSCQISVGGVMNDVTLVIEGGYPFATGGVSEWTNGLVNGLPRVSFAVAALREPGAPARMPAYVPPPNVTSVVEVDSPDELPEASVYHALSTGAAGAFAAQAAAERGRRFVLSEHGLAWLEARLGIVACNPHGAVRNPELVDVE